MMTLTDSNRRAMTIAAATLAMTCIALPIQAADAAPASPHTLTYNASVVSQYVSRGISQTWGRPALQLGADYSHSSGLYASFWSSSVTGNQYPGSSIELDFSGGYQGKINDDLGFNIGVLKVIYPAGNFKRSTTWIGAPDKNLNTVELYGSVSWKWLTAKYSHTLTDFYGWNGQTAGAGSLPGNPDAGVFANQGTKGSGYLDLSANVDLGDGYTFNAHLGYQTIKNAVGVDYTDYKFGVTRAFDEGWNAAIALTGTSRQAVFYNNFPGLSSPSSRDLGKGVVIASVGRVF
ncbi:MAG TPA: TorF family putative porin [Rhodocyclaceae bacterium]|nr:TorF family putative porin [Rhodocyclaceae bacterium]